MCPRVLLPPCTPNEGLASNRSRTLSVQPDFEEARDPLPDRDPVAPHPQPRLARRVRGVPQGLGQEAQVL